MSSAREERYLLETLTPAKLTWSGSSDAADVLLENVSAGGAAITLYDQPGDNAAGTLEFRLGSQDVRVSLRVKWSRETGRGQWLAGCQFDRPLGKATIGQAGLVARPDRQMLSRQAVMRRESAPDYPYAVALRDVSAGGVCIAIDEPFDAAERVILEFEGPDRAQFVLRAQWAAVQRGESVVGFSFEDHCDGERFRRALGLSAACNRRRTPALGASGAVLVGTLLAAAVAVLTHGWPF